MSAHSGGLSICYDVEPSASADTPAASSAWLNETRRIAGSSQASRFRASEAGASGSALSSSIGSRI
jgi:hypothetical protein